MGREVQGVKLGMGMRQSLPVRLRRWRQSCLFHKLVGTLTLWGVALWWALWGVALWWVALGRISLWWRVGVLWGVHGGWGGWGGHVHNDIRRPTAASTVVGHAASHVVGGAHAAAGVRPTVVQLSPGLAQRAHRDAAPNDRRQAAALTEIVLVGRLAPDARRVHGQQDGQEVRAHALAPAVAVGAALDGSVLVAHLVAGAADGVAAQRQVVEAPTQGLGEPGHIVSIE